MRKVILLGILALASAAHAQSGAAWLGYSSNARNQAEAGGLGAMADGADGLGLNPAALSDLPGNGEAALSYGLWPGDIGVQHLEAALRTGAGVVGLNGSWIDFGDVTAYTVDPVNGAQATGSMNPHASDLGLGLGGRVSHSLALGLAGHILLEDLVGQGTSSALAFDAGARLDVLPAVTLAASMVNVGGTLDGSPLPTALRVGLAVRGPVDSGWEVGAEASDPMAGGQADLAAALRYQVATSLVVRTGWLQGAGLSGAWSMGASFQLGIVGLDYGFRQMPGFSPIHTFTLRLQW